MIGCFKIPFQSGFNNSMRDCPAASWVVARSDTRLDKEAGFPLRGGIFISAKIKIKPVKKIANKYTANMPTERHLFLKKKKKKKNTQKSPAVPPTQNEREKLKITTAANPAPNNQ